MGRDGADSVWGKAHFRFYEWICLGSLAGMRPHNAFFRKHVGATLGGAKFRGAQTDGAAESRTPHTMAILF